jgi:hypothetical protein
MESERESLDEQDREREMERDRQRGEGGERGGGRGGDRWAGGIGRRHREGEDGPKPCPSREDLNRLKGRNRQHGRVRRLPVQGPLAQAVPHSGSKCTPGIWDLGTPQITRIGSCFLSIPDKLLMKRSDSKNAAMESPGS